MNLDKMGLFFSPNTTATRKSNILSVFDVHEAKNMERYLGLPTIVGKSKKKAFGYLLNKIQNVIAGWNHKLLSKGDKETLLKAVAHAIPVYTMSLFLVTPSLCAQWRRR